MATKAKTKKASKYFGTAALFLAKKYAHPASANAATAKSETLIVPKPVLPITANCPSDKRKTHA